MVTTPTATISSRPPRLSSRRCATCETLLGRAGAAQARLSGSGSTVFGLFPDVAAAAEAARGLEGLPAGSVIRVVPTLTREESRARSAPRRSE
ncbi:MAG: hypothetical protein IPF66_02020 [Holophagales bacterium]|nr:hypothetical protein [Holophagales bacterium]